MNELVLKREEIDAIMVMAEHAFQSKYFEKIGGKSAIFTIMARAREIGMPVMEAVMGGMNIIQGKVEISPRSMNAMIRRAGHKVEIQECTHLICKLKGTRKDTGESLVVTFSIEDAKRAGICKGAWITYPDDMCFKSALSKLARRLFADVISTSYIEGETSGAHSEDERDPRPQEPEIVAASVEIINPPVEEIEYIDPNQEHHIMDLIGGDVELLSNILDGFGIQNLSQLPAKKFAGTCRRLTELKKSKEAECNQ
jgi:hypothetical protein